jgi:CRISPR/Cas system endoribonuclease Cas6 (RAMP superfamily)
MISLKVLLLPKGKYNLKDNYEQELRRLFNKFIFQNSFDYIIGSSDEKKNNQLSLMETDIKLSKITSTSNERNGSSINFHDGIKLIIGAHSYDLIMKLVQGFYKASTIQLNNDKFEVQALEVFESFKAEEFSEVS